MKLENRKLYADEGKVLDFAAPKFAQNAKGEPIQVHLYTKWIRLGIMDNEENYIEVDEGQVS